jgi:hypothetical protein
MQAAQPSAWQTEILPVVEEADTSTSPAPRLEPCPVCGTSRSGDDRYCENCGRDFLAPASEAGGWEVVASVDRRQFERHACAGVVFPEGTVERRFALDGPALRIGRRRGPGELGPEIDLGHPPEDPGVSRLHAVLERQPDGSYTVRDLGSTNGTTVNDDPDPVGQDDPVQLGDGDRVRVGAWTTLTIRAV